MDINELRGLATLLCMAGFMSVVFWAYSSRRKKEFEEASMLPFEEDEHGAAKKGTENSA